MCLAWAVRVEIRALRFWMSLDDVTESAANRELPFLAKLDKRVVFLLGQLRLNVEPIFVLVFRIGQRWWFSHQALRLVEARGGYAITDSA